MFASRDGYNSLENPIGIETSTVAIGKAEALRYNSLENPIGIETKNSTVLE